MQNFLDFLSTALLIGAWVAASLTVAALLALAGRNDLGKEWRMTEFYWNPDENRAEVRRSVGKSSVTFPCRTSLDEFDVLCLRSAVIHYFPLTKGYNL